MEYINSIRPGAFSQELWRKWLKIESLEEFNHIVEQHYLNDTHFQKFNNLFQLDDINPHKLFQAFIHRSFSHELSLSSIESYERLELIGDSVIELIVTENLLTITPKLDEGVISKLRSQFVSKRELSKLGKAVGLGHFIFLGKGESQQKLYTLDSLMADLLEAVIGAVYLNKGLDGARNFLIKAFELYSLSFGEEFLSLSRAEGKDYKGRLQEIVMRDKKELPIYTDVELSSGEFLVTVTVNENVIGKSIDKSKKQAQVNAAKTALASMSQ